MSQGGGTLYDLTDQLRQISPEHLDLFASHSDDEFQIAFDSLLGKALAGLELPNPARGAGVREKTTT